MVLYKQQADGKSDNGLLAVIKPVIKTISI